MNKYTWNNNMDTIIATRTDWRKQMQFVVSVISLQHKGERTFQIRPCFLTDAQFDINPVWSAAKHSVQFLLNI